MKFFSGQNLIIIGTIHALQQAGRQHDVALVGSTTSKRAISSTRE